MQIKYPSMNHKFTLTLSAIFVLLISWSIYQSRILDNPKDIHGKIVTATDENEAFSGAGKSLDTWSLSRSYPTEKIPSKKITESHQVKKRLISNLASSRSDWQPLGPQNFAGRILTIAIDPNAPQTLYAGAASGGLWKSIDDGAHWNYVPTGFPVLGVSSIVINPNNSDEILIGTGEVYGDFDLTDSIPNQGTGQGYTIRFRRGTYGIGILKTIDGGLTWNYSLDWSEEDELKGVNMMRMSPFDANIIFAGTSDGLYKSEDAGATWSNILDLPNVMSIAMHDTQDGVMLVGVGNFGSTGKGVYRSVDGINFSPVGLPDYSGKTMLDFSKDNPDVAFASVANHDATIGLYRSVDAGVNWSIVNDYDYARYQGWYGHDVAINPNNDSHVLAAGINLYRSTDNGGTLIPESDWLLWNLSAFPIEGPEQQPGDFIHADIHDVVYHPNIPDKLYVASDGGVFKSDNDGLEFVSANTGLQTVQFYQKFSSSMQDADFAMGGLQDNATAVYRGSLAWERVIGGDGFGTIIDPNDDNHVWGSLYYMRLFYSKNKAQNFIGNSGAVPGCIGVDPQCYANFSAPICFAPSSLNQRIYAGSNLVYTIEDGTNRTETNNGIPLDGNNPVNCLGASHQNEDIVFAGIAPIYTTPAKMFKSENGGDSWTEVTNGLPDRFPMEIQVDPCDDNIIYVVFGGYNLPSHVYRSMDGGDSWNALGQDLPDVPTNTILIDPENTQHIYIGNDIGVFASTDGGTTWMSYASGLPDACLVMSLSFTPVTRKLRIATHGNGVYENDLLHEITPFVAQTNPLAQWYMDDFEVSFSDEPSVCVFQQCFYTIRDYNLDWRGNNSRGFITEDFDQPVLNSEWSTAQGTWMVNNEILQQTNSINANTQLNIDLAQTDTTNFMYQWKMRFDGNGNEKRAGIHFFADDLSLDTRGNSYLVNFFENTDQIRIYQTDASGNYNTFLIENVPIPNNQWLDCRVVYESQIGRISVFLNDKKVAYFVDETPLQNGNGFSFRTGNAAVSFDDVTVYQGRECSGEKLISVQTDGDCRFESQNDTTFVCGIQSVGFSVLRGWSIPNESLVKIGEHPLTVQGSIFTELGEGVKEVSLNFSNVQNNNTITDDSGFYQLNEMSGNSFVIKPEKLDSVKNGVNTFDMVLIRKHILGLELLDSPYKRIAADVNKSGVISTFDLVKIRLLILNMETQFVGNTSWRFAPADYVMPTPVNTIDFPDSIIIHQLATDLNDVNFIAIKTGDVNLSADPLGLNQQAETRTDEYVIFLLQNKKVKKGEQIRIPFFAKDFQNITGYQMSIQFDKNNLEFISAHKNENDDLVKENFGTTAVEDGILLMNWVSGNSNSIEDNTELFYLNFKAQKEGELKDWINITDQSLRSEAYNDKNEFLRIGFEFMEEKDNILTNVSFVPNPFSETTELEIESKTEEKVEVEFFDSNGRLLNTQKVLLQEGENNIIINFSKNNYRGIIFYKIQRANKILTGKIVKI